MIYQRGIPASLMARSLFEKPILASSFLQVFTKFACNEASLTVREAIIARVTVNRHSSRYWRVVDVRSLVAEEARGFRAFAGENRDFSACIRGRGEAFDGDDSGAKSSTVAESNANRRRDPGRVRFDRVTFDRD